MGIEVDSLHAICFKCGTRYSRRKGYFPVSYAISHKGIGHTHICKDCIDKLYTTYLSQCNDPRAAVRQVCRKLDIYFSDGAFNQVEKKATTSSMMTQYIAKINTNTYIGKSYDDTLLKEGTLWDFTGKDIAPPSAPSTETDSEDITIEDIPKEVIDFWGAGYKPQVYLELEDKLEYWKTKLPEGTEFDIGTEVIIKQICALELDISRDRALGKSVDKNINALNTLLGSANLKPAQRKDDLDASIEGTPMGVWIERWEKQRPIPEPDPELSDVDGIVRYITVWYFGHLCKMLGIKNSYCKLYEEELAKIRVERPEYEDEDDETLFNDIFSAGNSDGDE